MTLIVGVKVPEGIAVAADSRVTEHPSSMRGVGVAADDAVKMRRIPGVGSMWIALHGKLSIGETNAMEMLDSFAPSGTLSGKEVADEIHEFYLNEWNDRVGGDSPSKEENCLGFHVYGASPSDSTPAVVKGTVPGSVTPLLDGKLGVFMAGEIEFVERLVYGMSPLFSFQARETDKESIIPREQHNHSSGLFIGRNNYGDIRYEMLDPKTRAMLEKLSMDAPPLANLLTESLNDGIISPDAIDSLWLAGRNINEDIAESLLLAGKNINMDVADSISQGADTLSQATDRLDYISSSLNKTAEKLNGSSGLSNLAKLEGPITEAAKRIERVFTPPPPEIIVNWKTTFKVCFWVFILGVAAGAGLIYYLVNR